MPTTQRNFARSEILRSLKAEQDRVQADAPSNTLVTKKEASQQAVAGPTSAVEKVLTTVELLEAVLLHLPPKGIILRAQRVSKTWKATIDNSVYISRLLWRKADPKLSGSSNFVLALLWPHQIQKFTHAFRDATISFALPHGALTCRKLRQYPSLQNTLMYQPEVAGYKIAVKVLGAQGNIVRCTIAKKCKLTFGNLLKTVENLFEHVSDTDPTGRNVRVSVDLWLF
jgi:hypothetical protein